MKKYTITAYSEENFDLNDFDMAIGLSMGEVDVTELETETVPDDAF